MPSRMTTLLLTLLLMPAACGEPTPPDEPSSNAPTTNPPTTAAKPPLDPAGPPPPDGDAAAISAAQQAMKTLGEALAAQLAGARQEGGPAAAAKVCNTRAAAITSGVAEQTGVTVGRSSLRLRNPANGGPDWVNAWLQEQGERPVAGLTGKAEVIDTEDGRVARALQPLGVAEPCLACHGPGEAVAPEVADVLAAHYPDDAATGYAVGQLRGVIWAEVAVAAP